MDINDQAAGALAPGGIASLKQVSLEQASLKLAEDEQAAVNSAIEAVARKVVESGLATPAVFMLELHKPLTAVVHTAALAFEPISGALFGFERVRSISALLSDRENIEALIIKIETYSAAATGQVRL